MARSWMNWSGFDHISVSRIVAGFFILAIIAGMLLPALGQVTPRGRRLNCAGNLKQIGLALIIYADDNKGVFPAESNLSILNSQSYLMDGKAYVCPSCDDPNTFASKSNYAYIGAGLVDSEVDRTRTILAHDRIENHADESSKRNGWGRRGWVNVLFVDGHVTGLRARTQEEFHEQCADRGWVLPDR